MKHIFAFVALAMLVACGVDGEPEQPTMNVGIGVGSHGVSAGVGIHSGPFSIWLGG